MRSVSAHAMPIRSKGPYPDAAFPYGAPRATPMSTTAIASERELPAVTTTVAAHVRMPPGGPSVLGPAPARAPLAPPRAAGGSHPTSRDDTLAQHQASLTRQKFDKHKCTDPFRTDTRGCKTLFSQSYVAGSLPCRLQSSATRYSLQWDAHAAGGFSPDLLVVCADGLTETEHPFTLMAPMMFAELVLRAEGCVDLFAPVMEPVCAHLRKALMKEESVPVALQSLHLLVQHTGALILPYMPKLLMCLSKPHRDKRFRDQTVALLGQVEANCGPDATKLIKSKIPTYG